MRAGEKADMFPGALLELMPMVEKCCSENASRLFGVASPYWGSLAVLGARLDMRRAARGPVKSPDEGRLGEHEARGGVWDLRLDEFAIRCVAPVAISRPWSNQIV
jgi:hypothetical protein